VTALFRGGTPAFTEQALADHADRSTTQEYAHVAEVDLRDAIRRLRGNSVVAEPREG
jgi:site-specific recombinase XerD